MLLVLSISISFCFSAGKSEQGVDKVGLSGDLLIAAPSMTDLKFDAFTQICQDFMDLHPNTELEFVSYGKDYESLMKGKMAANDLPDVFATHGWAVKRYAEYLRPLNDLSLVANLSPAIIDTITTSDGDIVTVPLTIQMTGILYNKDVLAKAGWTEVPKNWDEFKQCCQDIKDIGLTPIYMAGKNPGSMALFMDFVAPSFLTTWEEENYEQELYDGTFDWMLWDRVGGLLKDLSDAGYLNKDSNTADTFYIPQKLAYGECGFVFRYNENLAEAWEINPDAKLSFMPVPVAFEGDEPVTIIGEQDSFGIWNETENMELAVAFLEYLASKEVVEYFCNTVGDPSGLKSDLNLGLAKEYTEYGDNYRAVPFFDREYFPSGIWGTMKSVGAGITSNEMSVREASQILEEAYNRLRAQ